MRKASFLIAIGLAALSTSALAEPGLPDPVQVAAALDAHPSVLAAEARTSVAGAEADALRRGPHEFSLSASYMRRSVDREGRFDEYDATLSRAVRLPGKARLDREIGVAGIEAAKNRAEDARHQAALLLAQGWWDWLGAAEEARVDRQAVENYSRMLAATRRRVSVRDAAQLEADQAEGALGAARIAAVLSAGREAVARARLTAQFPGLPLPDLAPEVPRPDVPQSGLPSLGAKIIARSHEIAAAEADALKAATIAERARRDRIADPSLGMRLFSERNAAWTRASEGLNAQVAALMKLRLGQSAGEIDLSDMLLGERQVHDAFRMEAIARTEAMRALTRIRIDAHELWITE